MTGAKITYAQSSDIKSRTYLEYRRDMKKKAIAELEFLPFLRDALAVRHGDEGLQVVKHGKDAELWFAPAISQEPDYKATSGGAAFLYEFQYAESADNLTHFDFKVSKVGKKKKGARIPHEDRAFFYVVKPGARYAFITPQWIIKNGKEAAVPAWGSRPAYRIPRDVFVPVLQSGGAKMAKVIKAIDDKNALLEYQHSFLDAEAEKISRRLQCGVDENKLIKITPTTPEGFYEVCFLLDKLNKSPSSPGVWMVYLISMAGGLKTPMEWARFVFALDFLYAKAGRQLSANEQSALINALRQIQTAAQSHQWQGAPINPRESSAEETRQMLFVVNLLEDLRQECAVSLGADMPKVAKIFETVPNIAKTADFVRKVQKSAGC